MTPRDFPATDPQAQPEEVPFYEGLLVGEFRVPWCSRCQTFVWRPKSHCTACYDAISDWRVLPGTGEIYSYCVVAKGDGAFASVAPYVLAWVALDEGPTVLANIADGPDLVQIGYRVRLSVPTCDDRAFRGPVFMLS